MRRHAVPAAALLALASSAHADPDDIISRPLTLARGHVEAQLAIEANLAFNRIGQPLSLAPDAWVGITDKLTLGLTHSNSSLDRIASGASFCVQELFPLCNDTYRGSTIDARFSVLDGPLAIAPRARLILRDTDPAKPALALGADVRWYRSRFLVESDPYLRLGLYNRDKGNRANLDVPIFLGIQPTCRWLIAFHTGWDSDLAVWRDGWHIPIALLVRARATTNLDVSVEGGLTSAAGPQNNSNQRAIAILFSWRT
ncbi:hypothetical protein BH11MYX2_BH11MYX2_31210 [soil metagenome]